MARAEVLFRKEERIHEGAKTMAEYKAEQQAVREKTAKLRALRLARDNLSKLQQVPRVRQVSRSSPYRPVRFQNGA
jgi:hypothetical protein